MKTIKYYQDPAHGWIAVKLKELEELGIANKISSYSYVRGKTAYLEEDMDAQTYMDAQKARGVKVQLDQRHTNHSHPIRSYGMYMKPEAVIAIKLASADCFKVEEGAVKAAKEAS